jgi:serpin B
MFTNSIQETDFTNAKKASALINDWVQEITREKIKDLIKPEMLRPKTKLVLVNAIYFKGDWQSKFNPKRTSDQVR